MLSIRDLLVAQGIDLTGWSLAEATAVSADGRFVVGYGLNPSGQTEAWLVDLQGTPIPESAHVATASLLAVLGFWVMRRRPAAGKTGTAAVAAVVLCVAALPAAPAAAQTTTWNGTTGNWSDAARWNNGVPNSASFTAVVNGGSVNFDLGPTTIAGLNLGSGTASITGSGGPLSVETLNYHSGSLQATSMFTATGALNISGGALGDGTAGSGNLTAAAGSTLTLTDFTLNNGANLTNAGSVQIKTGTLNLAAGGTHGGSFSTSSGATLQFGGGTHNFNAGASVAGTGALVMSSGNVVFGAGSQFASDATVTLSGGTATFDTGNAVSMNSLTVSIATLAGADTISVRPGGTLTISQLTLGDGIAGNGNLVVAAGSTLLVSGNIRFRNGSTFVNSGTGTWTGNTFLGFGNTGGPGAAFSNSGSLTATGNGFMAASDGSAHRFDNSGSFIKDGGTAATTVTVAFNNTGSVQVRTGTLSLSSYTQTGSAAETVLAGGTIQAAGAGLQLNGGFLRGSGTVNGNVIGVRPYRIALLVNREAEPRDLLLGFEFLSKV